MAPKENDFGLQKFYNQKPEKMMRRNYTVGEKNNLNDDSIVNSQGRDSISILLPRRSRSSINPTASLFLPLEKFINNLSVSDFGNQLIFNAVDKMDYMTLTQNFLNSEEVIAKTLKIKYIKPNPIPSIFETNKNISKLYNYDLETKTRKYIEWSGQDILEFEAKEENYDYYNNIMSNIENINIIIWPRK